MERSGRWALRFPGSLLPVRSDYRGWVISVAAFKTEALGEEARAAAQDLEFVPYLALQPRTSNPSPACRIQGIPLGQPGQTAGMCFL